MTYLVRRFSHERRAAIIREQDVSLTFHQDSLQDSGKPIGSASVKGPAITFTRASSGTNFNESGVLVTASTDEPRFHHDPANSNAALGLLTAEGRANLCLESATLDQSPWVTAADTTLTSTTSTAPDGSSVVWDIKHDDNSTSGLKQRINGITADTIHCASAFVKQGTTGAHDFVRMDWSDLNDGVRAWFDLTTGNVGTLVAFGTGTATASGMIDVGDGWFRIWMSGKGDASDTTYDIFLLNAISDGSTTEEDTNSVFWWGAQVEEASFPTAYIATTTAAVARSADVDSVNISSELGATANTLVISARTGYDAGVIVQIDDGTENERYRIERNSSNEMRLFVTDGGVEQVGASGLNLGTVADRTNFKVAVRLAANDFAGSLDGAAIVSDPSGTLPTVDTLRAGMDTSGDEWNSTIAEVKLFNVGKPNTFLTSETS